MQDFPSTALYIVSPVAGVISMNLAFLQKNRALDHRWFHMDMATMALPNRIWKLL